MQTDTSLTYHKNVLVIPVVTICIIWLIYWLEIRFGYNFNKYGIYPRSFKGLRGVFLSPFIHSDVSHLFNNSAPLFALMASLFYFYKDLAFKILLIGTTLTGFLCWSFARDSYHI